MVAPPGSDGLRVCNGSTIIVDLFTFDHCRPSYGSMMMFFHLYDFEILDVWIMDLGVWILEFWFWILDLGFWSFDFGVLIFGSWILDLRFLSILDLGFWIFGFGISALTVWLSSASTWGTKSTHTFQRGLRENPKG